MTATSPRSPEPGSTRRPSSVNTAHVRPEHELAVSGRGAARRRRAAQADRLRRAEAVEQDGVWAGGAAGPACSPGSTSTPDELDEQHARQVPAARVGVQRLQHRRGEGQADDDDARWPSAARPRPTAPSASNLRDGSVTTVPPRFMAMSAENWPVPCISGQAGSMIGPQVLGGRCARPARSIDVAGGDAQQRVAAGAEHVEQVVLAPHHALGHAGGAAGVEQQQVVAASGPRAPSTGRRRAWPRWPRSRRPRPEPDGRASATAIPAPSPWAAGRGCRSSSVGEGGVEHHGLGVGVVEQVDELFGPVAVVGVDRREARP